MKHNLQSILLALLSLNLSAFSAEETPLAAKAAQAIVLPNVTFVGATVQEVVSFLNIKSKAIDPEKKGVAITVTGATDSSKTVDLQLSNATVLEILQASAGQLGLELKPSDTRIQLIAKASGTGSPVRAAAPAETRVAPIHAAMPSEWSDDFARAVEKAKAEKKNLLLNFTGSDWCGFCISLHKEVFASPEFKTWAGQNAVTVTVDFPRSKKQDEKLKAQNAELKKKYMPTGGYPTVVVIDPDGKVIARKTGYHPGTGTTAYLEALNGATAPAKN